MNRPDRPGSDGVNDILPPWVEEDRDGRATPYSEAELDDLVEGTIAGIDDTDAWHKLVAEHGEDEARRRLRAVLILRDENARRAPRH